MQSTTTNPPPKLHAARPYERAYARIAALLCAGACPTGAQLVVSDIARELRLSSTPVREALARLVGEGCVEDRRGQGYFVPRLAAHDIVELYVLITALARIAIDTRPRNRRASHMHPGVPIASPSAVDAAPHWNFGELLVRIAAASGNALLAAEVVRLSRCASAIWRAEDRLFPELRERQVELEHLFRGDQYQRLAREIRSIARLQQRRALHVAALLAEAQNIV